MQDLLDDIRQALIDAQYMFLNIERNRNLPGQPEIVMQYVVLGNEIKAILERLKKN